MAIAFEATTTAGGSGTTASPSWPTTTSGHVCVAHIHWNGPPGSVTNSDFTFQLSNREYNGPSAQVDIAYRVLDGTETGSTSFSSDSNRYQVDLITFSGVDNSSVYDVVPSASSENTGSGSTNTTNSLTTITNGAMMIALAVNDSNTVSFTGTPSGWNVAQNNSGNQLLSSVYLSKATAGLQGAISWTQSSSNGTWLNNIYALKPAAAATGIASQRLVIGVGI